MNLHQTEGEAAPDGNVQALPRPQEISPQDFYRSMHIPDPAGAACIVTTGPRGAPNDHAWSKPGTDYAAWATNKADGRNPAYHSPAIFQVEKTSRFEGRKAQYVIALPGFCIDVEGSSEKYNAPGGADKGYPDGKETLRACGKFARDTGLVPTHIVMTGSGGAHLYYVLAEPVTVAEWIMRARSLVALAEACGFKIDAQCTTDAARIMRAPGSIHQKTGKVVQAYKWAEEPYTLEAFDALVKYQLEALPAGVVLRSRDPSINAEALPDYPKYSYLQAAKRCGAMRKAAERNGAETPYPVWVLAIRCAELSVEGREFAHELSAGHPDYDEAATDKKLASLTGGPAGCDAWRAAWGHGGPCDRCEYVSS